MMHRFFGSSWAGHGLASRPAPAYAATFATSIPS